MSGCRLRSSLDAYVDGELSPERTLEVEEHLESCRVCQEQVRFTSAIKLGTREVVLSSAPVSAAFRARVEGALEAERRQAEARAAEAEIRGYLPWRTILPVAAAAAITLVWAASVEEPPENYATQPAVVSAGMTDGTDQLIDDFVRFHARGGDDATPAVVEPTLVSRLEPEVGVPVRAPSLSEYGASWEGGTVVRVSPPGHRAALLRYRVGNHRVSVYVYDATRWPLRARLEPRVVHDVPVYVGQRRGYSIAATERRGVGYAAAADLDDQATAELVAAAYP
ncbi:MAG TPA: zf-HC2 domain-containing protein [Polyangiaceae bacterium]|nr:zf-HC2 domain-containing protein [Polyangiaceae bacterium]